MLDKEQPNYEDEIEVNYNFEALAERTDAAYKKYIDAYKMLKCSKDDYDLFVCKEENARNLAEKIYYANRRNTVVDKMVPYIAKLEKLREAAKNAIIVEQSMVVARMEYLSRHYHSLELEYDDDLNAEVNRLTERAENVVRISEDMITHDRFKFAGAVVELFEKEEMGDE